MGTGIHQSLSPLHGAGVPGEEDLCDSGATVRLKGMNQQDRKLVNRWWNDQLQRCGDQNVLAILIGEECGTLVLGQRANLMEMTNQYHSEAGFV
jgi:isochorismate hydrolase